MEQVRDLNMEADNMQVVLSAISGISKRIKEVHRHTSRSLAVSTFSRVKRCAKGCTSALAPYRTIGTEEFFPTHSLQGRYSTRLRTWKGCWRRITILSPFEFSIIIRLKIPINKYCQYRILPIPLYPKLN